MTASVRASRRAALAYHATTGLWPVEAAGCRKVAVARSTGTVVAVYEALEAGLEDYGFATVCEDHGRLVVHESRQEAESHASNPEGWCGVCAGTEAADVDG